MVSLNYPECRAKEVDSGKPRTVYACGSSDYAQLGGTFEKGFDCFYGLRITNEKERSKWMDERMAKGYSFRYLKNEKRENVGVFCVETQEEFNYIFEGPKTQQASAHDTVSYYSPTGEDAPTPVGADVSSGAGLARFSKTELEQHIAKLEYQLGEINEHGLGDSDTALTKWTIERDLKIFKADLNYR